MYQNLQYCLQDELSSLSVKKCFFTCFLNKTVNLYRLICTIRNKCYMRGTYIHGDEHENLREEFGQVNEIHSTWLILFCILLLNVWGSCFHARGILCRIDIHHSTIYHFHIFHCGLGSKLLLCFIIVAYDNSR